MSDAWKVLGNCAHYVAWLEYEFEDRRLAFALLDDILFSKKYGGAERLCAGCPIAKQCRQEAIDNGLRDGWWGNLNPPKRQVVETGLNLRRLLKESQESHPQLSIPA